MKRRRKLFILRTKAVSGPAVDVERELMSSPYRKALEALRGLPRS